MDRDVAQQIIAETQGLTSGRLFRNFVAQAHSRAVLQRLEADPAEWPQYSRQLDGNLIYTAHLLFWQGLQLRTLTEFRAQGDDLIKQGAEILEFLYSEGDTDRPERVEQLFNSALGYYIAGHYARAYVLMKDLQGADSLTQEMELLRRFFLKDLVGLRNLVFEVLADEKYSDSVITRRLEAGDITEDEALDRILRASINRAFSYFIEFPKSGRRAHLERSKAILDEGIELAETVRFVNWWWLFYCARHLLDEFDENSLWTQLGPLRGDDPADRLVEAYIRTSYRRDPPVVELWRTQTKALPRINEAARRSYCLKMPTSAGKTRVAELAILRFLLDYPGDTHTKCIYVAPFRSLAVEMESSLRESFHPLGIRVSELYGGFEISPIERLLTQQTRVIVATPEKIDAFLRYDPEFADRVGLVVVDEGHIISPTERGIRFELFLHRLITRLRDRNTRFFFLSAVLPNVGEFAAWITGSQDNVIESDWRPSRLMLGELRWSGHIASIEYTHCGYEPLEHECYVSSFIRPLAGQQLEGTGRRNPFPHDMGEVVADAALRFAQQDMTLVFVAQKRSVEPFGRRLMKAIRIKDMVAKRDDGGTFALPVSDQGRELLAECIDLARETMGDDAEIIEFLEAGFAVHHGDLPQKLRAKIEDIVRAQRVRLIVATTTLAQGVNFPIRTVLVQSLHHDYRQTLSPLDFWNICGRAGRGMKENEGQILFAVDGTQDRWRRGRQEELRGEIIEGYRTYRLLSALAMLLGYIVREWQTTHPTVDVAELSMLLAENSLEWAPSAEREDLAEWLDFLDAQLIALMEEQDSAELTADTLQALLQNSLLMLQLRSQQEGALTPELAKDLLFARLQSIRTRFPVRARRQRFYRLGLPLADCQTVDTNKDGLLAKFLAAQDYCRWTAENRCDFLASVLEFMLELRELRPDESSLSGNLKRNWRQVWRSVLALWLQGQTANEMVEDPHVAEVTNSPAELGVLIDDWFGYRAPWGLNALAAFLEEIAKEAGQDLPPVTSYFPALLKYGVHSPVASSLLALGVDSRRLALLLATRCPDEEMQPRDLLAWFTGLTEQQLSAFGFAQDEMTNVLRAQREAADIGGMAQRADRAWTIEIRVPDHVLVQAREGDTVILRPQPDVDKRLFALHTLWGQLLVVFELPQEAPEILSLCNRINVTVVQVQRNPEGNSLTLSIQEV